MFFMNRIYGNRAILKAEEMFVRYCGDEEGGECSGIFGTITSSLVNSGTLNLKQLWKVYRSAGLSISDTAIALIDGSVTHAKTVYSRNPESEELKKYISMAEGLMDSYMKESPGKVLPRNGAFAKAAEKAGLTNFFK